MKPLWLANGCVGEQKVSSSSPRQVTAVVRDRLETHLTAIRAVLNAWSARLKDLKIKPLFQEQSDCTTVCVTVSSSTETHPFPQVQMRPSLAESWSSFTPPRGGICLEECFFTLRPYLLPYAIIVSPGAKWSLHSNGIEGPHEKKGDLLEGKTMLLMLIKPSSEVYMPSPFRYSLKCLPAFWC